MHFLFEFREEVEDNESLIQRHSYQNKSEDLVYNEDDDYVFDHAFTAIKWNIRNQDLWDSIGYHPNSKDVEDIKDLTYFAFQNRKKIYDWMQKNYGKYEIAPQW